MTATVNTGRSLQNRAVLGVVLMFTGLALYPISDAFIKHLMGTYTVHQTTFLRAITRIVPLLIAVFFQGGFRKVLWTNHPKRHLARLAVNLFYTYSFMYAFSLGSLTVIYTLSYTSPFFMILLSAFMLKETVSRARWAAVAIGMVGVIVAMRPGSNVFETAAILVLFGAFLSALNKILMRRLAETEHSLAIAIYPNIVMLVVTLPFVLTTWQSMPWNHWGLFAIVGILTAAGQYAIAQSVRFTQASTLAPIDYSTFFWVVSLDYFWWHKSPDSYTLIGALIIVSSNLYILYCTRREEAKKRGQLAAATSSAYPDKKG
ncbi:MAG: DMT family transporter [Chlamydiae bacterium]|nr:DMT family transporter [Chlamydiota bacterium]